MLLVIVVGTNRRACSDRDRWDRSCLPLSGDGETAMTVMKVSFRKYFMAIIALLMVVAGGSKHRNAKVGQDRIQIEEKQTSGNLIQTVF